MMMMMIHFLLGPLWVPTIDLHKFLIASVFFAITCQPLMTELRSLFKGVKDLKHSRWPEGHWALEDLRRRSAWSCCIMLFF